VNPLAAKAAGRRPVDPEQFIRALDMLSDVGPATLSIMLGMPGDDLDGFRRTLDFVARVAERPGNSRVRMARVHWMLIAPGSQMWLQAEQLGLEVSKAGIPYVLGTPTFPKKDIIAALHILREHPRSDLFVWEDAEPLAVLDSHLPAMFASSTTRFGLRDSVRIEEDDVRKAIAPLVPGRPLRGPWKMGNIERENGWPVISIDGPNGRRVRMQLRPRNADPKPFARTRSFDILWIPSGSEGHHEHGIVAALADLIRKNDGG
jgi:hypothetical protein